MFEPEGRVLGTKERRSAPCSEASLRMVEKRFLSSEEHLFQNLVKIHS